MEVGFLNLLNFLNADRVWEINGGKCYALPPPPFPLVRSVTQNPNIQQTDPCPNFLPKHFKKRPIVPACPKQCMTKQIALEKMAQKKPKFPRKASPFYKLSGNAKIAPIRWLKLLLFKLLAWEYKFFFPGEKFITHAFYTHAPESLGWRVLY